MTKITSHLRPWPKVYATHGGRVLTIMEAAFPDKEQRNAIKTLIKKEFRREMSKSNSNTLFDDEE